MKKTFPGKEVLAMNLAPHVAAVHDLSGMGRCSLGVVLPVLSAMGVQCCPLPTAYLSTHTGGFEGNTFLDMTDQMAPVSAHWQSLGLRFDAIYTGFMGSREQMALTAEFLLTFRRPGCPAVVDPVMGDHGRPYRTYTPQMCRAMGELADRADVIVPNATEAALLLGVDWEQLRLDQQFPKIHGLPERVAEIVHDTDGDPESQHRHHFLMHPEDKLFHRLMYRIDHQKA